MQQDPMAPTDPHGGLPGGEQPMQVGCRTAAGSALPIALDVLGEQHQ